MATNKLTPRPKGKEAVINNSHKDLFENGKLKIPKTASKNNKDDRISKRKILCIKCNKLKGISKRRMERNLKKFPDETTFRAQYLCRDCRKDTKKRKPKK